MGNVAIPGDTVSGRTDLTYIYNCSKTCTVDSAKMTVNPSSLCYGYSQVWNKSCDGEIKPVILIINLNTVFPHLQELLLGYNKKV